MPALGPLGLVTRNYGSFIHYEPGTKVTASTSVALGPHGLPFASTRNVIVTLDSGVSPAGAGNAQSSAPGTVVQLGPHGLVTQAREFTNKGTGQVDVTLSGASLRIQGEELEGTHVLVRISGASARLIAINVSGDSPTRRTGSVSHAVLWDNQTFMFDSAEEASQFLDDMKLAEKKRALDRIRAIRSRRGLVTSINFDILERSRK